MPLVEIARQFNVSGPWVIQCRDHYYNEFLRLHHIPPGWIKATIIAPEDKLLTFVAEVELERLAIQHTSQDGEHGQNQ